MVTVIVYFASVVVFGLIGVAAYFGLWLCGMPAQPIGYAGAAVVSVALWHFGYALVRSIRMGE
jgi:hypothetical protein